jgi:hypothetical protein
VENENESLTIMGTIRADGKRVPLYILVRDKTARVETTQIGDLRHIIAIILTPVG